MRKRIGILFIITLLFPLNSFSEHLKLCYDVKALFVSVGETCIDYKKDKETLYFNSTIRSSTLASLVKRINDNGKAIGDLSTFQPKYFLFEQEESTYKATNEYIYEKNRIISKTIKYDKQWHPESEEIKEFKFTDYFEPFMLSMVFYKNIYNKKQEPLKLFYKNKTYNIPYKILNEEKINNIQTIKVSVKPFVKGKGLLIPDGEWYIYIDKENLYPIRIETKFVFIKATAYIKIIDGNQKLLRQIIEQYPITN